jgi:hypothetical protein
VKHQGSLQGTVFIIAEQLHQALSEERRFDEFHVGFDKVYVNDVEKSS